MKWVLEITSVHLHAFEIKQRKSNFFLHLGEEATVLTPSSVFWRICLFGECTIVCDLYFQLSLVCMSLAFSWVKYRGVCIIVLFNHIFGLGFKENWRKREKLWKILQFQLYLLFYQHIARRKKWNIRSWNCAKRGQGPCRYGAGKSHGFC